jgi:Fe-S cluster assembly scaffold IscU
MSYSKAVLDHYENPRNVGRLDETKPSVGKGMYGSPACGDVGVMYIEVDENDIIIDAKMKVYGCGSAIASMSMTAERIEGMLLSDAAKITNQEIYDDLALPPVKRHCSVLTEQILQNAIKDYRNKQGNTP